MGMDIYFQAFDANGDAVGERRELRCRGVYHAMNDWCEKQNQDTPANGERLSVSTEQWAEVAPYISRAIVQAELDVGEGAQAAQQLGDEWLQLIWPSGAQRVEYWFTI